MAKHRTPHEKAVAACLEDLMKLNGLPPYNDWSNIVYGDGYFAQSIERNYSTAVCSEARKKLKVLEKKWNKAQKDFVKEIDRLN